MCSRCTHVSNDWLTNYLWNDKNNLFSFFSLLGHDYTYMLSVKYDYGSFREYGRGRGSFALSQISVARRATMIFRREPAIHKFRQTKNVGHAPYTRFRHLSQYNQTGAQRFVLFFLPLPPLTSISNDFYIFLLLVTHFALRLRGETRLGGPVVCHVEILWRKPRKRYGKFGNSTLTWDRSVRNKAKQIFCFV